ncbi:NAD-dependent epimerase/dehydratase family protein [Bradyrhizobium frederickii]|uniref:NAD-dependent epimerase/dehydratase family protein n=1 Tax=Bradyrhizobium frederickii TaxID=2560054 RepID=A0A4Y9KYH5_9BRAD|nr:NAD-dependent epimerase/dehydratase family protein [Bradyrhizobium frederickii]TFV34853.1 NAD-dependent epimerase/dehydratase family protein [Bradyrhizobium frederickii]
MSRRYLVTGGTGFLGASLVHKLVRDGNSVRVLDNNWRGNPRRLAGIEDRVELLIGDIRDPQVVRRAVDGMDCVVHMSAINGTRYFYEQPELVVDVAIRGMLTVIDACRDAKVRELIVASSSEAYQSPGQVPTPENVPLVVPDVRNPRYSYGGSKLASELIALNYGRTGFDRVVVFRPHNVYGADMGFEHVVPEFSVRAAEADVVTKQGSPLTFPLKGDGAQTRAFIHVDDFTDGLATVITRGAHLNVYHIGTTEEVTIRRVAELVVASFGREAIIEIGPAPFGETQRRCPDISKIQALGWSPSISLEDGLPSVVRWYRDHPELRPSRVLGDSK